MAGRLLFPSFGGYRPSSITGDLVAGLTVWAVLVPESLAYATIAGVSPVVGLYAAVPALLLYAVVGSSRHLVVSPMSATAALSAGVVGTFAVSGADYLAMTTALALATGAVAIAAGVLRLGFLASLISEPVLKGFIIGLALTIMIGQVPKLLGLEGGEGDFFEKAWHVLSELGGIDGLTTAVGLVSLAALLLLKRLLPWLPGSLVVALLGIAAVALLDLDQHGLAIVGTITSGLPAPGLPDVSLSSFLDLIGPAAGVMLVGFAEGLGAAKTYAAKAGYDIDANRELLGLGAGNVGAGLCGGMVVNGSLSKTAVNGSAGARSQLSGMAAAVLTVLTLLFLTGLFEQLPEATLAAIVLAAVVELVDVASLRRLWRVQTTQLASIYRYAARADFLAAIAALLGVLIFDTLPGLAIGIAVSLVLLLARTSRPHVAVLVPTEQPITATTVWVDRDRRHDLAPVPGVLVVRVEGPLFFGNADHVRERVRDLVEGSEVTRVVLDADTMPTVDVTGTAMIVQLQADLARMGVGFALTHPIGQVRDVLRRGVEGEEPLSYPTILEALEAGEESPDPGESTPPSRG